MEADWATIAVMVAIGGLLWRQISPRSGGCLVLTPSEEPTMRRRSRLRLPLAGCAVVVVLLSLTGCAGTRVSLPQPSPATQTELVRLFSAPVNRSRGIQPSSRLNVVTEVDRRVLPAAERVCQRTFSNPQDCPRLLNNRRLTVLADDEGINAAVGQNFDLTVLGGLVRVSGSDDEIALVLAHEYSHALFGHVAASRNNSMWGELIAGLAGLAVIASTADTITESQIEMIAMDGTALGAAMGQTVFSKDMELEADHLALFILDDAGYEMTKGMQFFQRTYQIQGQMNVAGRGQVVGFFATHPSDEERLLQLMATQNMIERGATRPLWKQEQGQKQIDEPPSSTELAAVADGDAQAQYNLGLRYSTGRGVQRNDREAVGWYRKAAEQGHAQAQYALGVMYANGPRFVCLYRCGVARDDTEAVVWYRKAAEQGNADAQNNLGVMYATGRGVSRNDAEAVAWYRKAADQGHAKAQTTLEWMYNHGRGVPRD